jgi:hypothetical protein
MAPTARRRQYARDLAFARAGRDCGRMRRMLPLLALVVGASACRMPTVDTSPFQMQMSVSRSAVAPGDTVAVIVDAQGGLLIGVAVDYGDTQTDEFNTGGARTAHVTFRHAFTSPGTFSVTATVTEANAGAKSASVDVSVR